MTRERFEALVRRLYEQLESESGDVAGFAVRRVFNRTVFQWSRLSPAELTNLYDSIRRAFAEEAAA